MSKKRKREHKEEGTGLGNEEEVSLIVEGDEPNANILTADQMTNVQKKIHHGIIEMGRAMKKARDFEVRKIIKRIKSAKYSQKLYIINCDRDSGETTKLERLEKELHISKGLDVTPFAHSFLYKHLQSDKLFINNRQLLEEHLPPSIDFNAGEEDLTKNLVGRLNATTALKSTLNTVINSIHRGAGMETDADLSAARNVKKKSKSLTDVKSTNLPARIRSNSPVASTTAIAQVTVQQNQPESDSEEDASQSEESDPALSPKVPKKTTVLPALSTGYIPAYDSSDPDEELNSFAPLKNIRKNRRGQRERRAIWEKKYGKNARHLNPQSNETKVKTKSTESTVAIKSDEKTTDVIMVVEPVRKKVNETHPSWIAKQKIKEQQKEIMAAAKPQKKYFDD